MPDRRAPEECRDGEPRGRCHPPFRKSTPATSASRLRRWEAFYARHAVPGIRKRFFVTALWGVSVLSVAYLFVSQRGDAAFVGVLTIAAVTYLIACILITSTFAS